jgi:predicted RNA-binding Zn ribbon-like protein
LIFTHDTEHALGAVADLINTGSATGGGELLHDVAALREYVERNRISDVSELTGADVAAVRRLRARCHEIFTVGSVREAVVLVNGLVSTTPTTPRLTDHDGHDWHVHYFAPGARLADHLAAELGMALAFVVAAGELDRLRICEAPDCARVLVDLSRNRCRRYCDSRTCGNRMHVAAYRARQRETAS